MDGGFIGFNGGRETVVEEEDLQSEVEDLMVGDVGYGGGF